VRIVGLRSTRERGDRQWAHESADTDDYEQADAANSAVADWVAESMAGEIQLTESRFGAVLISTTLGVSTAAGASV
jgi:predicted alpha/beta hydrolase family esterase